MTMDKLDPDLHESAAPAADAVLSCARTNIHNPVRSHHCLWVVFYNNNCIS